MFSKRNQLKSFADVVSKISKLSEEKAYIITSSTHEVTVGRSNAGYYLIDQNNFSAKSFSDLEKLITTIKSTLQISSDTSKVLCSSIITPKLFTELDPSIQAIFKTREDLNQPMQTLAKAAGLQNDKSILQGPLIDALKRKGINASATDIAKLNLLKHLSTDAKSQDSHTIKYNK